MFEQHHSRIKLTAIGSVRVRRSFLFGCLLLVVASAVGAELRISETTRDGARVLSVRNAFYELEIRPENGATISSLRFGRVRMRESTAWEAATRSGLAQEVHTADVAFERLYRRRRGSRLELGLRGRAGDLSVRKVFEFRADSPVIRLSFRFENRSGSRLFGFDVPACTNLAAPGGREAPGTRYYSFDDGSVPRVRPGATVLRYLNPAVAGRRELRWLAVTDPATRRGLGFVFPDRAPRGATVQRNRRGGMLAGWSYPPIPAHGGLETSVLIVPLEGFAAVSELNERFAADTVPSRATGDRARVDVRLMPLGEKMQEVSVVSRAYDTEGKELQPCEPILYEDVPAWSTVAGGIELPPEEKEPAWLVHEVYSRGEKLGQFLGRVSGGPNPPPLGSRSRPDPRLVGREDSDGPAAIEPTEAERKRGFLLCSPAPGGPRRIKDVIPLRLFAEEWETIFVGFRALGDVEKLRASLTSGHPAGAERAEPLPAAAGYLWSVQEERTPATLEPFAEREIGRAQLHWLAITLDASQLEAGTYAGRLHVEADGKDTEVNLELRVSGIDLGSHRGFALWHIGSPAEDPPLAHLAAYGVDAAGVAAPRAGGTTAARRLVHAAGQAGLGLLGFHSPGGGMGVAEQLGSGVPRAGLLPAGPSAWLLWQAADSPDAPRRMRELGYAPAVLTERLTGLKGSPMWREARPDRWLVRNGCQPGTVPELIRVGWIRPTDNVWGVFDLRGSTWADAACRMREVLWAGAWQGLSGAAVRMPGESAGADAQVALWHVLRDAREEAAACAVVRQRAEVLSAEPAGDETDAVRRARLLANVENLIGRKPGAIIRLDDHRTAYRRLMRAAAGGESVPGGAMDFRRARNRAVELLEAINRISSPPATSSNLYWRGIPLAREGAMRWAIWAPESPRGTARAENLREAVKRKTGWELVLVERYPPARNLDLLWVFAGQSDPAELPDPVGAAAGRMHPGDVRTVTVGDGIVVVLVGEEIGSEALERSLLPDPTFYRPARAVK